LIDYGILDYEFRINFSDVVKTIQQEIDGTKGALQQEGLATPFDDDLNHVNLLRLVEQVIIDFEERWGS
jgi:hypothetical protein